MAFRTVIPSGLAIVAAVFLAGAPRTAVRPASAAVSQQTMFRASDGVIGDAFGRSVATSGNTIVVGAEFHRRVGEAYVFVKAQHGWTSVSRESARLVPSDGRRGDVFGSAVAIAGDTIAVSAPFHKVAGHTRQGEIYLFTRPAQGWAGTLHETARLITTDGATDDYFGNTLGLSGDTIVAGSYMHAVGRHSQQGRAYVFVRPASGWRGLLTETGTLTAAQGAAGDWFAWTVGISGNTIVAAAPLHSAGGRAHTGAVYVFARPAGGWAGASTETARLVASDATAHDVLGTAVAVSGDTVVASAPQRRIGRHPFQGELLVFVRRGSGWAGIQTQTGTLVASDGAGSGDEGDALGNYTVAISGGTIVSSSPHHTIGKLYAQGEAYMFTRPLSGWTGRHTEAARMVPADPAFNDQFGEAAAVQGRTIVIGAQNHIPVNPIQPGRGAAYVFLHWH